MARNGPIIGRIAEIWRYPVQSMQGERLDAAEIGQAGVVGDRAYGIVDPDVAMVVSSAQGRRKWRGIVTLAARYLESPAKNGTAAPIEIVLPDGATLRNDQTDVDARLGEALGASVHLADRTAENKRSDYSHSPLHVLTTASLRQLADYHPEGRFVPARFRPNLVIDIGGETGFVEQGWIERRFSVGDGVEIAITEHCKRCVMTTLPQGDLPMDPVILHTTSMHNQTRAGVYAAVLQPGQLRVGDPVRAIE
ncbi:MAG: MOSC domain-containing protein [Dongiaceae bacterium]